MTAVGVYVGNETAHVAQFEKWLGREADLIHGVVGGANWQDFTSSASWFVKDFWANTPNDFFWSVPLIVDDGVASLKTAATGAYNGYYRSVAQSLLGSLDAGETMYVRTGWEFNGPWFQWNADGKQADYIGAFRQFVTTFRQVADEAGRSGSFKFEWNVDAASGGMDPATAYPGDAYVDVIGMDFYWKSEFSGTDPVKAFEDMAYRKYGLAWLEDFAAAHGKPTGYSEWGVNDQANGAPYIRLVKEWFDSHDVAYQLYWDHNADYPGQLSDNSDPATGAAFIEAFGGPTEDHVPSQPTTPTTPTAPAGDLPTSGASTNQVNGTSRAGETLVGTAANDLIDGKGGGGDVMKGGAGDDVYVVNPGDVVVELAGQGVDTVQTWTDGYVLPDNVENLVLTGTGWNAMYGNSGANRLTGNDAPNVLDGRGGNDVLTGGGGDDVFVIRQGEGSDTITDFRAGSGSAEAVRLDGYYFRDFAAVKAAATQQGADTVIALGDGQTLKLLGVQVSALVADDFQLVNIKTTPVVVPPTVPTTPTTPTTPSTPGQPTDSGAPTREIWGTSGAETLTGTAGNDMLNGVGGGDVLKGGLGDDTYYLNHASDSVVELAGEGVDTVFTWMSHTLADNVENLVMTGNGWSTGTGNALSNIIVGNEAPNAIDGGAGNDKLAGGRGADTFTLSKGTGVDTITDFSLAEGDKVVLKGLGVSDLAGLKAHGTQVGSDAVFDFGGGDGLVLKGWALGSLTAAGFSFEGSSPAPAPTPAPIPVNTGVLPTGGAINGWVSGTSKAGETLTGGSGNDQINGNGGGDTLKGGLGDDRYLVTHASDKVMELAGQGVDTVETWLSWTLGDNVENLVLTGSGWSSGTGNALANRIVGNDAPNVLDGKAGNDVLTGGGGDDVFVVSKGTGHDFVTDFQGAGVAGGDTLSFKGFGAGAYLTQSGSTWTVHAADGSLDHVTLQGVTALAAGDYVFG